VQAGKGKLLVSSLDFSSPKAQNAATIYFFDQLLQYMAGPDFNPQTAVETDFLSSFNQQAPFAPLTTGSGITLLQPKAV
jgi:hypothetical protein